MTTGVLLRAGHYAIAAREICTHDGNSFRFSNRSSIHTVADNYGTALFLAARFADDRILVVLVHGIKGSPRDFAGLMPRLQKAGYQLVYFLCWSHLRQS